MARHVIAWVVALSVASEVGAQPAPPPAPAPVPESDARPPNPSEPTPPSNGAPSNAAPPDEAARIDEQTFALASRHRAQARSLAAAGHYDAAIAELQQSYALLPDPELQLELGDAYRRKGDRARAVTAYNAYLAKVVVGANADRVRADLAAVTTELAVRQRGWQRIVDRPLTLDRGRIGIDATFDWVGGWASYQSSRMTGRTGTWVFGKQLSVGGGYGISDRVTVGGRYYGGTTFDLSYDPFADQIHIDRSYVNGGATLYAAYRLEHASRYSVATNAAIGQDFDSSTATVALGLSARYRLTRRLAVFTGGSPIAPTYSSKLSIDSDGTLAASAYVAFEAQWSRRFYMHLGLNSFYEVNGEHHYRVNTGLLMYVTVSRNVDIGGSMFASSLGLDARIHL